MSTLKTSVVVVLLLAVLYGVYVVLSEPAPQPPAGISWQQEGPIGPPQIDFGSPVSPESPSSTSASPTNAPGAALPSQSVAQPASGGRSATLGPPESLAPPAAIPGPTGKPDSAPPASRGGEAPRANTRPAAASQGEAVGVAEPGAAGAQPPAAAGPAKSDAADRLVVRAFEKARRSAQSRIDSGEYQDALFDLSIFYDSPDLNETERQQLVDMLDPLAAKVVYSREHHLAPAHRVGQNETLVDVAAQYNVPWELLKNINGVRDPLVLVPRTELKVVRGPFRADIDLKKGELALFLGRLYAGRFPISTGKDPEPKPGEYQVREKRTDRAYYTPDGGQIPGRHADNPYGRVWIHLGGEVCIHGSPESGNRPNSDLGCISLSPIDADDVYGILSQGSKVTIRR